jgi:tetratricopeptide (TPR) repeat protein
MKPVDSRMNVVQARSRAFFAGTVLMWCLMLVSSMAGPIGTVYLKSSGQFDEAEILSRVDRSKIKVRYTSNNLQATIPIKDIGKIQFRFSFSRVEVINLYAAADYVPLAALLWNNFQPVFPYLDLPYEGSEYLPIMVNALYWAGEYGKLTEASIEFRRIDNKPLQQVVDLYQMLAAIDQKQFLAAEDQLVNLQKDQPELANSSIVLYARAKIQGGNGKWVEAQKTLARLVVTFPKDFEWMPPALLLEAQAYLETGKPEVASQILKEVRLVFPKARWLSMADDLQKRITAVAPQDEGENGAAPPIEQPAEKGKDAAPANE